MYFQFKRLEFKNSMKQDLQDIDRLTTSRQLSHFNGMSEKIADEFKAMIGAEFISLVPLFDTFQG